jgi:hypothetical protein
LPIKSGIWTEGSRPNDLTGLRELAPATIRKNGSRAARLSRFLQGSRTASALVYGVHADKRWAIAGLIEGTIWFAVETYVPKWVKSAPSGSHFRLAGPLRPFTPSEAKRLLSILYPGHKFRPATQKEIREANVDAAVDTYATHVLELRRLVFGTGPLSL